MGDREISKAQRRYPEFYEKSIPIAISVLVLIIVIMLVITIGVGIGYFS